MSRIGLYSNIVFYIDEEPLFETLITSTISSIPLSGIVFVIDIAENKIFLQNGYPKKSGNDANLNAFIKYLRENKKIKE